MSEIPIVRLSILPLSPPNIPFASKDSGRTNMNYRQQFGSFDILATFGDLHDVELPGGAGEDSI